GRRGGGDVPGRPSLDDDKRPGRRGRRHSGNFLPASAQPHRVARGPGVLPIAGASDHVPRSAGAQAGNEFVSAIHAAAGAATDEWPCSRETKTDRFKYRLTGPENSTAIPTQN